MKKRDYSKKFNRYIEKWGKNDLIINKQLGASYRLFNIFIENGKWKRLLKHPFLSIAMYFLRLSVGFMWVIEGIK